MGYSESIFFQNVRLNIGQRAERFHAVIERQHAYINLQALVPRM